MVVNYLTNVKQCTDPVFSKRTMDRHTSTRMDAHR